MEKQRTYIAIDLKSFYASVECVERGLDPLKANLVVADVSRTDKTICLAVSPSLKAMGISGRPRLFEVKRQLGWIRREHPGWNVDYIAATPRMHLYIEYSARIYKIYLKYIAPEDIHVYSIDEVFMDATPYLETYHMTAHELAMTMVRDVLKQTGITATAGIGTNLYLCKVAMDIVAKHKDADADGVRIAELDEMSYRRLLWNHKPLTDFWRVGHGIAARLAAIGVTTMGQLARLSVHSEEALYKMFGVNAELLIDHAWGWEPCTMEQVKAYRPESNSLSNGQVLTSAYDFRKARTVIKEMADSLALDLVDKKLVTDQVMVYVGFDTESLLDPAARAAYHGPVSRDWYGHPVPKHSGGSAALERFTSSSRLITNAVTELFDKCVDPHLLVRRLGVTVGHVIPEGMAKVAEQPLQLEFFTDMEEQQRQERQESESLEKEHSLQESLLRIKKRFGKNSILRGLDYADGATTRERNQQIGGHKA